jgi:cobalt-zinc-cadmium efflux system membrane fusion protein
MVCGFTAVGTVQAADGNRGDSSVALSPLGLQAAGIEVQAVVPTDLPNQISAPGKIEIIPTMQFDQHAALSGRIAKIAVQPGDRVAKGQVLAVIESTEMNQLAAEFLQTRLDTTTEFAAQRVKLDTEVKQADDNLHLCEENLKRLRRLFEDKIAAQKDVLQAETDYSLAKSRLDVAKQSRDIMVRTLKSKIKLIQMPIRQRLEIIGVPPKQIDEMLDKQETITSLPVVAARGGIVTGITASPGMSIDPSTNLFTIADLSKVWATAHVYESDMTRMHLGERVDVKVQALAGEMRTGVLTFVGSQVDPITRTLPVRTELNNADGRLKPDMYAELIVQTAESMPVVAVPKEALVSVASPAGSAVFVVDGSNYRQVRVRTGRELGNRVEVIEGLHAGDKIVVRGAFQLNAQLLKEHGGEDLFVQATEGERTEDHATDNKAGSMQMSMQMILIVVGAAFLFGFGISALLMFRSAHPKHECDAELEAAEHGHEHELGHDPAPTALPSVPVAPREKSEG